MLGGRGVLLVVLLLGAALAGCIGQDGDGSGEDLKETATTTADTGGIQGVVTDNAVQPVVGLNVTLEDTGESTKTAEDGSYAFSQVPPGEHEVTFRGDGFIPTRETVRVSTGEVAILDVIVTHLDPQEVYTQTFELNGFFECGAEIGWNLTDEAPDPGAPIDPRYFFLGYAVCAAPNSVAGNTTNDRFAHYFELDAPLNTLIYEMNWEASAPTSEWMTTQLEVQGFSNANPGRFWRTQGPAPVYERLNKSTFEQLNDDFTQACEDGDDTYCGYSFWDSGWPLQTRVFPAWQCASEDGGGCAAIQQEFTHFVTAFYNGPAPETYSIVEGNTE